MLYAYFENILNPVDEQYREKMKKMKTKRKSKTPYTEKINTYVPSGCCLHSTFPYGYVSDPLKMYRGKDCGETFIEHLEDEVKRLFAILPQQPMTDFTDDISVLKNIITMVIER